MKSKGRKQYISCSLQYQILKTQKGINHDEYYYHVKQFILASAISYCTFYIFLIYYVLHFPLWTSTLYFLCFHLFFIDQLSMFRFLFSLITLKSRYNQSVKRASCKSRKWRAIHLERLHWVLKSFKILVTEFTVRQTYRLRACNFIKKILLQAFLKDFAWIHNTSIFFNILKTSVSQNTFQLPFLTVVKFFEILISTKIIYLGQKSRG